MSNGVEVIVALDKSTLPGSPQLLRVLPTSNIRPITFTPHTVTDHMIMMLPHGLQVRIIPTFMYTYLSLYSQVLHILCTPFYAYAYALVDVHTRGGVGVAVRRRYGIHSTRPPYPRFNKVLLSSPSTFVVIETSIRIRIMYL